MENDEKKAMYEAEAATIMEEPSEPTVVKMRKKRNDFYIELALFFILGTLIGVAVKNVAVKKVTIGFDDYKMKIYQQDYDLNALQAKVAQQAQDARDAAAANSAGQGTASDGTVVPNSRGN